MDNPELRRVTELSEKTLRRALSGQPVTSTTASRLTSALKCKLEDITEENENNREEAGASGRNREQAGQTGIMYIPYSPTFEAQKHHFFEPAAGRG